jgi:hypothetical protein
MPEMPQQKPQMEKAGDSQVTFILTILITNFTHNLQK